MNKKEGNLVSIIIPIYNDSLFLPNALDSILNQTYKDIEIIVVDDGSTDKTEDVIKTYLQKYPEMIRYIRMKHSGLLGVVRNAGLRMAKGNYIAFIDADDEWLSTKLEKEIELLKKDKDVVIVCSNAFVVKGKAREPSRYYFIQDQLAGGRKTIFDLLNNNFVIISTVLTKRSFLKQVNGFTESLLLRAIEDYDLWLRVSTLGDIYYISEPLAIYRDHPKDSIRSQVSLTQYWKGMKYILERLKKQTSLPKIRNGNLYNIIDNLSDNYSYKLILSSWTESHYLETIKYLFLYLGKRVINKISQNRKIKYNEAYCR